MACLPTTGRKQPPLMVAIASKQTLTIDKAPNKNETSNMQTYHSNACL